MSPSCRPIDTTPTWPTSSAGASKLLKVEVRGKRVLLKPNLVEFLPDRVINTDPRRRRGCR